MGVRADLPQQIYGPIAAFLVELFPTKIRYASMSLPYHIGNGVFGGLVPVIGLSLIKSTGNDFAGLWYPMVIAGICTGVPRARAGDLACRHRDRLGLHGRRGNLGSR